MRGNFFYHRLGRCLQKIREKKHLSQEYVSLLCNVDRTYIARIEKGRANPTVKTLQKIASALKVKLYKILLHLCVIFFLYYIFFYQFVDIVDDLST